MTRALLLKSSILGDNSASSELMERFISQLRERCSDLEVSIRDLASEPVPPLDAGRLQALATAPEQRDAEQRAMVAYADGLISELQQADLLVIAAPMYNFTLPAGLKSWIDQVARAGVTFEYTENGPRGLLDRKEVVVIATMGGQHEPGESDHLRPYLRTVLNFLGLDRVTFVAASGLNLGPEVRQKALQKAEVQLSTVVDQVETGLTGIRRSKEAA